MLWANAKLTRPFGYKICVSNGLQQWAFRVKPSGYTSYGNVGIATEIQITSALKSLNGQSYSMENIEKYFEENRRAAERIREQRNKQK